MPELTVAADLAWRIAALEAQRGRAGAVSPDHLLVGLLSLDKVLAPATGLSRSQQEAVQDEQATVARLLADLDLDPAVLRRTIRHHASPARSSRSPSLHRDPACLAAFARAERLADDRGADQCGALDLLAALLEHPSPALAAAIGDPDRLRAHVQAALAPRPAAPSLPLGSPLPAPHPTPVAAAAPAQAPPRPAVPAILLQYGRDLTAAAEAGRLPPVVGRHDEMLQVVRVLHRRTKNGPVLIGEAGVGKTAVVEGLAQRIAEGSVLPGRRIVALSVSSVVAGTTYRGQFEDRLEEILTALRAHPHVILFLDELHTIVGAGDADGRLDAAGILKPALARGEIACIGATTIEEYRRHIESDPALERRFQPILVSEPTRADTLAILERLRPDLERHHGVLVEDAALHAAVDLTVRHVTTRRLPDKAVDALDEACASASVPNLNARPQRTDIIVDVRPEVTRETVEAVVAAWAGLPVEPALPTKLADLEARLGERVVGQPEAIRRVVERVRLARAGLTDPERPAAVLLLAGPPGVGKTALALALAEHLGEVDGGSQAPVRLMMAEYADRQPATRLLGAGPSGHDRNDPLLGPLRRSPRAVVLLDGVEEAHPDVVDALLPLLGTGRLTDAYGRLVDARRAVFMLTARVPSEAGGRLALGFGGASPGPPVGHDVLLASVRATLGPALLARIDEVVLLRPLDEADLREIARQRVATLAERLLEQHAIDVTVTEAAIVVLARRALAGTNGAREVDRAITRLLAEPLSRELHAGRIQRGAHILAELHGDTIALVPPETRNPELET